MRGGALKGLAGFKKLAVIRAKARISAFSLVELMVACAVLALILGLVSMAIRQMAVGIKTSSAKVDAFQSARTGFEAVNRTLGIATLNTYWDYFDSARRPRGTNTNFTPALYGRQSDLHFQITNNSFSTPGGLEPVGHAVFFQAPLGYFTNTATPNPPGSLNPCGFFVAYGNDPTKPNIEELLNRPRFRLYQWLPSSESLAVDPSLGRITTAAWIAPTNALQPLAENIIAFVVRVPSFETNGFSTSATNYWWNSLTNWASGAAQPAQMHQLPPLVNVTMVAVEEGAANRLAGNSASAATAASAMGITNFAGLFANPSAYDTDLAALESGLSSKGVPYRVFTTTIPLRGSRWSP
jgi:uncharacterized protein (TIGR02599 family)